uniref:Early transcription factor VETF large subunit n=1 Tax=Megaviridae environmental sample TaxID=1737588 RepID=A0A5J6VKW7_9VIRU|nr:MAG: hypothetical protein [Megaviridae environmental sample]
MNNPIKIIHKYKNNNRREQYFVYIFIGSEIPPYILDILNSIKNKNFYDSLTFLSKKNISKLSEYYGEFWYNKFFLNTHIKNSIESIYKNKNRRDTINNKLGKQWYEKHFKDKSEKKIYSFGESYHNYLLARNKIKEKSRVKDVDFTTYKQSGGYKKYKQTAGDDITEIDEKLENEINEDNDEIKNVEDLDDEIIDNFDVDELVNLYSMENIENDKSIKETSKLISEAINNKSWEKKNSLINLEFNDKYDEITYDTPLEQIFEKIYITDEYIFLDDTIKTIQNKISTNIPLSKKFGDIKLLPQYLYLWSHYKFNNKVDRVMIGQKWIRRNELLKIDIKPNSNLKVYENLYNNLAYLRDSFGTKIKREDDLQNLLSDYEDYITNNEIFMIDIYNELGLNYTLDSTKKKNIFEVYLNIYFPLISLDRFNNILESLNNLNDKEKGINNKEFISINNDVKLEKEIYTVVEKLKTGSKNKDLLFYNNHVIQSIIHVNLKNSRNITGTTSNDVIDLYKIFDNFIVSDTYPFIQYQTPDSNLTYKFYTKTKKINDQEILNKWFENAPYGISFKIKIDAKKYISINLHENNRIEYKITWKEEDKATVEDIKKSYEYINNLLLKINSENNKIKIILPDYSQFKFAFINTILKFKLPNKNKINHNDLSEFSRYFFPYVSLVIEPKKRQSSKSLVSASSKYGTYLRYKRVSKFENETRMHLRILYFFRNFEISDKDLILEVAKQFNITEQAAAKEIDTVRTKYGKAIKNASKVLKKFKKLPKGKPPGIGIDIQGRDVDNYKIRITGARSKLQLDNIVSFMEILIFLYYETYIKTNAKYKHILNKLKKLTNIAKRRNKVNELVIHDTDVNKIKEITSLDKKRLGFKPEEGQNQWTRSCQNSGSQRRQPIVIAGNNIKELLKLGYKLNSSSGFYEKKIDTTIKGKKYKTTVKAVKLYNNDNIFNFYTCEPNNNNEYTHIGFLSKSNNPDDLCMPCCFKKDQITSNNEFKKNYYLKCIGNKKSDEKIEKISSTMGDKLYILQDTNKVQEGRFLYLVKNLDYIFNIYFKHDKTIKNNYLIESNSGYFFKFTVKDNNFNFLAVLSNIFNMSIDNIKNKFIDILKNDTNDKIFTYLNNGNIKTSFNTRENFIDFIKNSLYLEYDILGEFAELPNVFTKNGICFMIFEKKTKIIRATLEKDKISEYHVLNCLNYENKNEIYKEKEFIFIIKESKYFFPIYLVKKTPSDKIISLKKSFIKNEYSELINVILEYYNMNCFNKFLVNLNIMREYSCKLIINFFEKKNIIVKKQIIDKRNKCRYLLLKDNILWPVTPSGTSYNYPILDIVDFKNSNLNNISDTIKNLKSVNKILEEFNLNTFVPTTIYYSKSQDNAYYITSILLKNGLIIPIKSEYVTSNQFKKFGLSFEFQTKEELIDIEIIKNEKNVDESTNRVNKRLYKNEGYNLFRLEISNYLNFNPKVKNNIVNIVNSKNISTTQKNKEIKNILLDIVNSKVKSKQFINFIKDEIDYSTFSIKNIRSLCSNYRNKDKCNSNSYCFWNGVTCIFSILELYILEYIYKIIEELLIKGIKYKELLQEESYYVSDIVDYMQYSYRPNQKIIKTSNFNIKKIMNELFGKNRTPTIGKRYSKVFKVDEDDDMPLLESMGDMLSQEVVSNNNSVIRAYVNSYFWINNPLYSTESRNLGFKSELQNDLVNLFKANIIDFMQNNLNNSELFKELYEKFNITNNNKFYNIIKNLRKQTYNTNGFVELLVLSFMFPYPIIVYNDYNEVVNIYSNGSVKITDKSIQKYLSIKNECINIKLYSESNQIPFKVYAIYYV